MIPHQRDPVTLAARFIETPTTTLAAQETPPQRLILLQIGRQLLQYISFHGYCAPATRRCLFCVSARLGKIKLEELDNASTALCGNVLRFIRTFEQYIEEIRPDSTKEEVIELLREFISDSMNFVHRQVLQISALHKLLREVLFAYGAVEKPVGGGYIPSRLIKVLVPDKNEYAILADVLPEAQAKSNRDSNMDDEELQSRTSEETCRAQRTRRLTGMTRNYSYTNHLLCAAKDETSVDIKGRMFCCNFLRKSRL
jgi:hypothetical protein